MLCWRMRSPLGALLLLGGKRLVTGVLSPAPNYSQGPQDLALPAAFRAMQDVGRGRARWKKGAGRVPRSHRHLTRSRCLRSALPAWPRGPREANANLSPWKSCSLIGLELLHLHLPSLIR